MERLQDDIDEKADAFGTVTFFEAYLYASEAQKAVNANSNISKMGPRELKIANVSPYLAQYGTIPPQPSVEDELMQSLGIDLADEAEELIRSVHAADAGDVPYMDEESVVDVDESLGDGLIFPDEEDVIPPFVEDENGEEEDKD